MVTDVPCMQLLERIILILEFKYILPLWSAHNFMSNACNRSILETRVSMSSNVYE